MITSNGRKPLFAQPATQSCDASLVSLYRPLVRTLLRFSGERSTNSSLLVGLIACGRGEGVTTVAVDLAWAAAESMAQDVALVDANPENPRLGSMLLPDQDLGLSDAILQGKEPSEVAVPFLRDNLKVIAAGSAETRSQLFDNPPRVYAVLEQLRQTHRLVICDLPAIDQAEGALEAAAWLDGLLLVVDAERTNRDTIARARRRVAQYGGQILGAILNKSRPQLEHRSMTKFL